MPHCSGWSAPSLSNLGAKLRDRALTLSKGCLLPVAVAPGQGAALPSQEASLSQSDGEGTGDES